MNFNELSDVLTVEDLMDVLHIGRSTAYKLVNSDKLRTIKVGAKHLIPKASVMDFLDVSHYNGSTHMAMETTNTASLAESEDNLQ
jgi:excisionase family DNA binding protein